MSDEIAENIARLREEIPPEVRLIAVSKTHSAAKIRLAYAAGIRDFGENRFQEAQQKQAELEDLPDIRWHFIGHLQKNKAKKAIALFDWIHTVDSLALAQKLDQYAADLENPARCCLQIKPLPDPNKFGWEIPQLLSDLPHLATCQHLKLQGLMTILPLGLSRTETQMAFEQVFSLREQLNQMASLPEQLTELSMGMSGDYPLAIEAGATMIRVGQGIFGARE
ncbi:YggS family pyridoxal phosphate-dependent enzyme [Picosynechococcus sp. PCC 11901]|uniref:YggS family pyridoxal phosphate-dependent enzyme n=1 Tax=Picosynechococcus sp. PCC 11901 TaxID=2579791 RepID=UPI0010FC08B8|nr:YggS family pyridoxal phosphate-dependent enzyme [Picosynechococcus sp. PCC 11901]QCS50429.1 YggS family pyridoxal phosphate-dependent enzyme [Picosynechococcus sp. PCC 11901]